jgi:hypothetical protein
VNKGKQHVLINDFLRKNINRRMHVLIAGHFGVETEIFHVEAHDFGLTCGNETVESNLCGGNFSSWCADTA